MTLDQALAAMKPNLLIIIAAAFGVGVALDKTGAATVSNSALHVVCFFSHDMRRLFQMLSSSFSPKLDRRGYLVVCSS